VPKVLQDFQEPLILVAVVVEVLGMDLHRSEEAQEVLVLL